MGSKAVIDREENKTAYIKKMNRQISEVDKKIRDLENIAEDRGAADNSTVSEEFQNLKRKLNDVHEKFEDLKEKSNDDHWPQMARNVSGIYKELESIIDAMGEKVKRK